MKTVVKMAEHIPASALNAACEDTDVYDADLKMVQPFRLMVTGPSTSGKSSFILNLVKFRSQMFSEQFGRILYCRPDTDNTRHVLDYEEKLREEFDNLEVVKGLPDLSMCCTGDHCLVSILSICGCQVFIKCALPIANTRRFGQ